MLVTIYTDGGLSPVKGQSYAYYCKSNRGVLKAAVYIKNHFDISLQVEAYAAFKAIDTVLRHWKNTSRIILNTDNRHVMLSINGNAKKSKNKRYQKIINAIKSFNTKIEARHVRGHQKKTDCTRAYLNNWCDRALNKVRKQFSKLYTCELCGQDKVPNPDGFFNQEGIYYCGCAVEDKYK